MQLERTMMMGSQVITNLKNLKAFGPEKEARVRQRLSKEDIASIESADRLSWLPLSFDIRLTEAVMEELGEDALWDWSWKCVLESIDGPLFGTFIRGFLRIMGIKMSTAFKVMPMLWRRSYMNCGTLKVVVIGPTEIEVIVDGYPPELANNRAYCLGLAASLYGVLVFLKLEGKSVIKSVSASEKQLVLQLTWNEKKK